MHEAGNIVQDTARLDGHRPPVWILWSLTALLILGITGTALAKTGKLSALLGKYASASVVLKVRDADKLPVEGAQVSVAGHQLLSDANGRIQLDNVRPGNYAMTVKKDGYLLSEAPLSLQRGDNPLQIVSLALAPPVRFALRGYVQDALSKTPITDVRAQLGSLSAISDPNGQFGFPNLLPGTFSLQLSANGYVGQTMNETLKAEDLVLASLLMLPTGQIVFNSNRDGKHGIYVAGLDGTNQHRLLPGGAGEDFAPLPSPDGNHIVFQSTRDALVDPAGHPLRRLYMISADGSGLHALSNSVSAAFSPVWSPNSSRIYFQGYANPSLAQATRQIYDLAVANVTEIADAAQYVVFSPDSQQLAYSALGSSTAGTAVSQLKLLPLSGGATILASRPQEITDLHFLPDGSAIGYQVLLGSAVQGYQIGLANRQEASAAVRADSKRLYAVSPNGKLRAFIDRRDGKSDLFVNAADGSGERQLTQLGTADSLFVPGWDPGSRYLTFATSSSQLMGVAVAGGEPYHLTEYSPN